MSRPEAEILVHIAAPARAADDTKYRTLAAAYLEFEPTRRISVALGPPTGSGRLAGDDVEDGETGRPRNENVPLPMPELGVIQSPLLSFQSAINNFRSPRLQEAREVSMAEPQSSWQTPPSVVGDSMPDNDLLFPQYCTPARILSHYTSGFDSTQSNSSPASRRRQPDTPDTPAAPSRHREPPHTQGESEEEVAIIPLSAGTGSKRRSLTTPTPPAILEETRIASSYPSHQEEPISSLQAESEPPLSKRPRTFRNADPGHMPMAGSASEIGPQPRRGPNTIAPVPGITPDTLEIISPPPATAQQELRPEDMITDVLASLARELSLDKRFRPEAQMRHLRPFERGYWLVDCASWESELKRSAWRFLTDYLGRGAAGWGTSCRRDRGFSWIRLYCWGCVVGHTYLVLYLMSKRRVLYTGTAWIGADGKPVVVMGARAAPA